MQPEKKKKLIRTLLGLTGLLIFAFMSRNNPAPQDPELKETEKINLKKLN